MSGAVHIPDRALTLTQPWAGLVASGVKQIENRVWRARSMVGKCFAIHASRQVDQAVRASLVEVGLTPEPIWDVTSAIIGVATLYAFVESQTGVERMMEKGIITGDQVRFWMGPIAFVLKDIKRFEPIACTGARSFWAIPSELQRQIGSRLEVGP